MHRFQFSAVWTLLVKIGIHAFISAPSSSWPAYGGRTTSIIEQHRVSIVMDSLILESTSCAFLRVLLLRDRLFPLRLTMGVHKMHHDTSIIRSMPMFRTYILLQFSRISTSLNCRYWDHYTYQAGTIPDLQNISTFRNSERDDAQNSPHRQRPISSLDHHDHKPTHYQPRTESTVHLREYANSSLHKG